MIVSIPTDPWSPPIRYTNTLGPASRYPRDDASVDRPHTGGQRGPRSAIASVVLATVAFGARFVGGMSAADSRVVSGSIGAATGAGRVSDRPRQLTHPGVVVPLE